MMCRIVNALHRDSGGDATGGAPRLPLDMNLVAHLHANMSGLPPKVPARLSESYS